MRGGVRLERDATVDAGDIQRARTHNDRFSLQGNTASVKGVR